MPYNPNLEYSPRAEQGKHYDRLAHLFAKIGKGRYPEAGLRKSLAASHILTKDGEVRQDRLAKWAKSRGLNIPKFRDPSAAWEHVIDNDSP